MGEIMEMNLRALADEECDQRETHTPAPYEPGVWREWAADMAMTHDQRRCEGSCRLWVIWVPRSEVGSESA